MKKDLPSSGKEIGQRALSRLSKDKDFAGKEIDRGIWPMKKGDRTRNPSPVEAKSYKSATAGYGKLPYKAATATYLALEGQRKE